MTFEASRAITRGTARAKFRLGPKRQAWPFLRVSAFIVAKVALFTGAYLQYDNTKNWFSLSPRETSLESTIGERTPRELASSGRQSANVTHTQSFLSAMEQDLYKNLFSPDPFNRSEQSLYDARGHKCNERDERLGTNHPDVLDTCGDKLIL